MYDAENVKFKFSRVRRHLKSPLVVEFHEYFTVQCNFNYASGETWTLQGEKNDTATLKERCLHINHISFVFRETPYFVQDHVPVLSIKKILLGKLKPENLSISPLTLT